MKIIIAIYLSLFSALLFLVSTPLVDCTDLIGNLNGTPTIIIDANFADGNLTTPEIITKYGYPCEVHNVVTPDGYILEMHRIPYGKNSPSRPNQTVVFIQHGLLSSSFSWVANAITGNVLPFILADEGYDVFLGNFRGNSYGLNHTTLNSSAYNGPFWNFSVDEHGKYDVTTSMDYALNLTGQRNLIYIGQSMGTTAFFVAMSVRPDFNSKIRLGIQLAPVVYLTNMINPMFRVLAPLVANGVTQGVLTSLGPGKYSPNNAIVNSIKSQACVNVVAADLICDTQFFLVYGFDYQQLNNSQLPVYLSEETASTKSVIQLGQFVNVKQFRKYDYGPVGNLLQYKQLTPPLYDLTKVTAPVAMYYGNGDWLADAQDAKFLADSKVLPNLVFNVAVPWSLFNHADFVIAKDVKTLLYDDMVMVMQNY